MSLLAELLPALGLIVGGLLLVRRLARRGAGGRGAGLHVSARASLSRNAAVAVVEVDGQRYLVGGSDQQVSLLAELPAAPAVATSAASTAATTTALSTDAGATAEVTDLAVLDDLGYDANGPGNGLVDRLRAMTVRTAVGGSVRAPLSLRR